MLDCDWSSDVCSSDLEAVPPSAGWVRIHYEMKAKEPNARLIARLWSGALDDAVVIEGPDGDATVHLIKPQWMSFQVPTNVDLKMKVTAYREADPEEPA
jgi:hypothetical protein